MREFGKSAYQIHRYLVSALTKSSYFGLIRVSNFTGTSSSSLMSMNMVNCVLSPNTTFSGISSIPRSTAWVCEVRTSTLSTNKVIIMLILSCGIDNTSLLQRQIYI